MRNDMSPAVSVHAAIASGAEAPPGNLSSGDLRSSLGKVKPLLNCLCRRKLV